MENILKSDFDALSCFQVTQILRGKLFIYIDNIMTFDYEDIEKNDMIKILDFIFLYIKLCCKYLKKFQLLYSQVIFFFSFIFFLIFL